MSQQGNGELPRWLKPANRANIFLHRLGLKLGAVYLISVPGRRTGKLHTTPVAPPMISGQRYIIAGRSEADWVKNAKHAGWGILTRGRNSRRVQLVEIPLEDRAAVLREFQHQVPQGARLLEKMHGSVGVEALAPVCPIFRVIHTDTRSDSG